MSSARSMRLFRLAVLLLCAAAILLREPRLLLAPRLFGEDGSNFYRFAFQNHALDALRYLPVNGPGYYSFVQDAAAAFAVAVAAPEHGAQIFLWISLLVQLTPVLVVLFGRSYVWDTPARQALVCALVVFSPAGVIAVWLNLVIAMNHFGLAALCVLMEDFRAPVSRARAFGLRLLLVVGGLTGPWVVALTPLFALKAWRERSREARVQLGLLLAACLVQGLVVFATVRQGSLDRERATVSAPTMRLNVAAVAHVLRPLFGELIDEFADATGLHPSLRPGSDGGVYLRGLLLLLPLLLVVAALILPPPWRWQRWALLGGLAISSAVASFGAYGVAVGRYAFIPGIAVALLLVDNLRAGGGAGGAGNTDGAGNADARGAGPSRWLRLRRGLSAVVLALSLVTGVLVWRAHRETQDWEPVYPAWAAQVALWRASPSHVLAGTPADFDVDLQRRGIASDLKAELATLEGVTLAPGGRQEASLAIRGLPGFGRIVLDVETASTVEDCALRIELLMPDGQVLSSGLMKRVGRRSRPGHLVLVDGLPRGAGLLAVAGLRLRLEPPDAGAITIRRARFGDELLFF